jgi:hypothetical protein
MSRRRSLVVVVAALSLLAIPSTSTAHGQLQPDKKQKCTRGKVPQRLHGKTRCVTKHHVRRKRHPRPTGSTVPTPSGTPAVASPASGAPAAVEAGSSAACPAGVHCSVSPDPSNGPIITGQNPDGSVITGCAPDNYILAFYYYSGYESTAWYNPCQKAYGQWSNWFSNQDDWNRWGTSWQNYTQGAPLRWYDYH